MLERRFPVSDGFGTLFPARKNGGSVDTGLIKAFSQFYAGSALFTPATGLLQWNKFPPAFLKDRSAVSLLFNKTVSIADVRASMQGAQ